MPLRHPHDYRDKTADWQDFFAARRRAALKPLVTPALLAEHAEDPRGADTPHSPALQDVLNYLHNQPTAGKSFAYAERPYARYRLGHMQGRGQPPVLSDGPLHASEREAVHAVFLARLVALGLLDDGATAP